MKNEHSVIVVPEILNLDNNTIKIVDPRGQNEGNSKEKLIEAGYTLVSKNAE